MSSSYSSLDFVLSHWAHIAVRTAYMLYYCEHCAVDLMGLKPNPYDLTSFSALTLLVGSFDDLTHKNPSPIWPIMCLVGR